jgi:hypothetical protein
MYRAGVSAFACGSWARAVWDGFGSRPEERGCRRVCIWYSARPVKGEFANTHWNSTTIRSCPCRSRVCPSLLSAGYDEPLARWLLRSSVGRLITNTRRGVNHA